MSCVKAEALFFLLMSNILRKDYIVGSSQVFKHQQREDLRINLNGERKKTVARHFTLKKQQGQGGRAGSREGQRLQNSLAWDESPGVLVGRKEGKRELKNV